MKFYVQYHGYPVSNNDGYGAVHSDLLEALSKHGWEQDELSPIAIIHALPAKNLLDEYRKKAKYLIAFTMLESTKIPESWASILNEFDEVWVPSEWVKEMFIQNGVTKPIYVIPHGLDPEVWKYFDRTSQLTPDDESPKPVQVLPLQRVLHEQKGMGHATKRIRGRVQRGSKGRATLQNDTRQHTGTSDNNPKRIRARGKAQKGGNSRKA